MRKILPIILVLSGVGGGIGAGLALRPPAETADITLDAGNATVGHNDEEIMSPVREEPDDPGYVRMNNQFVVPIIEGERVVSLVVLSISLETEAALTESIYSREPKLRDAFLQVLFDHAYVGGFSGVYTSSSLMDTLRSNLRITAQNIVGDIVANVLITDILRQDL